jgi:predicted metal-dependent phosphoesterase TrpH
VSLDALAITDHDRIAPTLEDRVVCHDYLEVVTGVEVRVTCLETMVELLGYYVDPNDRKVKSILETARANRRSRNESIIDALLECSPFDRSYESLRNDNAGLLTRPHIAKTLVEDGIVDSTGEAFDRFLGHGGAAYVPMESPPASDVIEAIRGGGGVVSLAHPGRIRTADIHTLLEDLTDGGLDAIEVRYSYDRDASGTDVFGVKDAAALAEEYDLIATGGSDCHGPGFRKNRLGDVRVAEPQFQALRDLARARRAL